MPRNMISMFCQWAHGAEYRKCHTAKNTRVKTFITLYLFIEIVAIIFCLFSNESDLRCIFVFHIAIILLFILFFVYTHTHTHMKMAR